MVESNNFRGAINNSASNQQATGAGWLDMRVSPYTEAMKLTSGYGA